MMTRTFMTVENFAKYWKFAGKAEWGELLEKG
jgi:hypothetical protein